jgi:uncharacterized membrane protein
MFRILGVPMHPAVVHFPIAAAVFAVAALAGAVLQRSKRTAWLDGAALILAAGVLAAPLAAFTGRQLADAQGYLGAAGALLPQAGVFGGLPRLHAILALAGSAALLAALALTLVARKRSGAPVPALLAAFVAAALIGSAGHIGGTMVHAPPPPSGESAAPSP